MAVALAALKSLASRFAAGVAVIAVRTTPAGSVSEIVMLPAGEMIGALQVPVGAGPAATVSGAPPTLNEKLVPRATPPTPALQMRIRPEPGGSALMLVMEPKS